MPWTRIGDEWPERRELAGVDIATRWHYLTLLTTASRGRYWDGVMPYEVARRTSDHPDPDAALQQLARARLVELRRRPGRPDEVVLPELGRHLPPPSARRAEPGTPSPSATSSRRARERKALHEAGDHSRCLPRSCPMAAAAFAARAAPSPAPPVAPPDGAGVLRSEPRYQEVRADDGRVEGRWRG